MWLLLNIALAAPPTTALTDDERTRLRTGEVVVRAVIGGTGAESTGIVLVHAPPDAVWKAVLDFPARIPESENLETVTEYDRKSPQDWSVNFGLNIVGVGGELNLIMHCDPSQRWCSFDLDPARDNMMSVANGYYRVDPLEDGQLLTYFAISKPRFYAPGFVQRLIAERDMEHMMGCLRARSEGKTCE